MSAVSTPTHKRNLVNDINVSSASQNLMHDDEAERQDRRQSLAPLSKRISSEEMKTHFELCQKLFIENKITPKNAWDLRIIDYFMALVSEKKCDREPLRIAATVLEICTKVYGCRVDNLHAEGLKLFKALTSQKGESLEECSEDHTDTQSQRRKKKNKPQLVLNDKRYIAQDIDSLLGDVPVLTSMPFHVDMYGDPEETTNLFTMIIPFDQYYSDHLRDKETPAFLSYNHDDKVNNDIIEKYVPKIKKFRICVEFENFEVNAEDGNPNRLLPLNISHMGNANMTNQTLYDNQGQPIVELDGPIHDIFADQDNGSVCEDEVITDECQGVYHEVQIVSFSPGRKVLRDQTLESNKTNNISSWLNTIMVAPNHWKNKKLLRSALRYSGTSEQQKVVRKRKVSNTDDSPINFFVDPPKIDFTAKAKKAKRVIDEFKYIMPRNYLKRRPLDDSLMTMNYNLVKAEVNSEEDYEHEYEDYNYNNANDSQYCIAQANNQEAEGVVAGELMGNPNGNELGENEIADNVNLTNEPMAVTTEEEKIVRHQQALNDTLDPIPPASMSQLPYARHAKNVNMKRIKTTMVQILQEYGIFSQNTNNSEVRCVKFSTVYDKLKSGLPQGIREEMTVSIAFFALLHLTNEKSLHLKNTENIEDVLITNEVPPPPHLR